MDDKHACFYSNLPIGKRVATLSVGGSLEPPRYELSEIDPLISGDHHKRIAKEIFWVLQRVEGLEEKQGMPKSMQKAGKKEKT
ncbi:hypothetical protein PIB30_067435 [Stylosanthes scabra]|uniref:Uncharacterized protein n=1 Tax=Stylosanthes scabra TaxID=79078 RepID=A0ABU6TMD6_9FABA|nr:hypothetical protein [Stylosanthes scabra]